MMMHSFFRFFLTVILLLGFTVLAAAPDFEQQLIHDPAGAFRDSLAAVKMLKDSDALDLQQRAGIQWMSASRTSGRYPSDGDIERRLNAIYQQLKGGKDILAYLEYSEHYSIYLFSAKGRIEALKVLGEFLEIAKAADKPSVILNALVSRVEMSQGKSELEAERMQYAVHLQEFLKKETRLSEEEKLEAQLTLAGVNGTTSKGDYGVIFERIVALALDQKNYRKAATKLADMAISLLNQDEVDDNKVEQILNRALEIAKKSQIPVVERFVLDYQAFYYNYRLDHEKALATVNKSEALTDPQDYDELANLYREKAIALIGLKHYDQALEVIQKLKKIVPESLKGLLVGVTLHESNAYVGLGNYEKALETYRAFHDLYAEYKEKEINEQFAKASAGIGLDIESQKHLLLQKENELQAEKLKAAQYLRLAALVLSILLVVALGSLLFALWQTKVVKISRSKMKDILDLIEEGIIMIHRDLKVDVTSSRFLSRIYPDLFRNSSDDVIERLFPVAQVGEENQSIYRETLQACFGEELLSWELNQGQLPRELQLKLPSNKLLMFGWQPAFGSDQRIQSFLLSVRDVTKERELELKLEEEHARVHRLQVKVQEVLSGRFQDARTLLERLPSLLEPVEHWSQIKDPLQFKRELHTAKGEARALGLKCMSQSIHMLESALLSERDAVWQPAWIATTAELAEYRYLIRDVLAQPAEQSEQDQSLLDIAGALVPQLKRQLAAAQIPFSGILVDDRVQEWTPDLSLVIRSILIHALTNAADHGYIFPKQRGEVLGAAVFRVKAEMLQEELVLTVEDQGVGLNLQKLADLAKQKGLVLAPDQSVTEVLFFDGLSTADKVSQTSGRGVGLAAIRATCRAWKGDAWIKNGEQGQGTELRMLLNISSHKQELRSHEITTILAS